ncbi:hypothetical protein NBRC10513_004898 [Rhodotorula toruloides]
MIPQLPYEVIERIVELTLSPNYGEYYVPPKEQPQLARFCLVNSHFLEASRRFLYARLPVTCMLRAHAWHGPTFDKVSTTATMVFSHAYLARHVRELQYHSCRHYWWPLISELALHKPQLTSIRGTLSNCMLDLLAEQVHRPKVHLYVPPDDIPDDSRLSLPRDRPCQPLSSIKLRNDNFSLESLDMPPTLTTLSLTWDGTAYEPHVLDDIDFVRNLPTSLVRLDFFGFVAPPHLQGFLTDPKHPNLAILGFGLPENYQEMEVELAEWCVAGGYRFERI